MTMTTRCLGVLAMALLAGRAQAEELTAEQIVDRSLEKNAFGFDEAIARVSLKLISKSGSERVREIEIRSIVRDDLNRTLVRFHAPADVAGTGFLVLENADRDDDQYLYLPALGKVKRITGSQRNQRFMGTDLTYADLESRNLRKSTSKRLADAQVDGNDTDCQTGACDLLPVGASCDADDMCCSGKCRGKSGQKSCR